MKNIFLLLINVNFILALSSVAQETGTFTDSRDGKSYKTVKIGTQTWMAENLAFQTDSNCLAYKDDQTNIDKYGYLYSWEAAKKACPPGWHLPSKDEFFTLLKQYGGIGDSAYYSLLSDSNLFLLKLAGNGHQVWSPGAKNEYPILFEGLSGYSFFWSSTLRNDCKNPDAHNCYCWVLELNGYYKLAFLELKYEDHERYSVRCIKDVDAPFNYAKKIEIINYSQWPDENQNESFALYKKYMNSSPAPDLYDKALSKLKQFAPILADSVADTKLRNIEKTIAERQRDKGTYNYRSNCSVDPFYYKLLEKLRKYPEGPQSELNKKQLSWIIMQEPAIPDINYQPEIITSNSSSPVWNVKITFSEKSNRIGYCLYGHGSIKDIKGYHWGDHDTWGTTSTINVPAGKSYVFNYVIRSSDRNLCDGVFNMTWDGEDAAGNPLSFKTSIKLKGCIITK